MELTEAQDPRIEDCLPRQRGNGSHRNLAVRHVILDSLAHGGQWRGLPGRFGNWHPIDTRLSRGSRAGLIQRIFERLQRAQILRRKSEAVSRDSTVIQGQPDGTGAQKKTGRRRSDDPEEGWTTKIHLVAASARCAMTFALSPGQAGDGPCGRERPRDWGATGRRCARILNRADAGDETRPLALELCFMPVVLPNPRRSRPWKYDFALLPSATRSNGSFAAARASGESAPGSTNSTRCALPSSTSPSPSSLCHRVNRP